MIQKSIYSRKVVLIDEQDNIVGKETLFKAHQGEGMLHRASSIFLFRENRGEVELLIQQRSEGKIVSAGLWANTACGNVSPGQSYLKCALGRLKIELRIEGVELIELTKYRYQVACDDDFSENEITTIFVSWYDGQVNPVADEVAQYQWVSWSDLLSGLGEEKELSPWLKLMIGDRQVVQSLANFLKGKQL